MAYQLEILTRCDRCGCIFNLEHQDNRWSKHSNAIILADMDKNSNYHARATRMLCPECISRVKKFLNFEDDLNQTDD